MHVPRIRVASSWRVRYQIGDKNAYGIRCALAAAYFCICDWSIIVRWRCVGEYDSFLIIGERGIRLTWWILGVHRKGERVPMANVQDCDILLLSLWGRRISCWSQKRRRGIRNDVFNGKWGNGSSIVEWTNVKENVNNDCTMQLLIMIEPPMLSFPGFLDW